MELPCVLCCSKEDDELIFGKKHNQDQVVVHCNCLYLSSNLVQNGNDRNGILHFLKKDILMEKRRCRILRCFYCQRLGANIGCCRMKCRRSFHTKCGYENLAVSQFSGSYNSYCHQHVPKYRFRPGPAELCMICFESLVAKGTRFSVATSVQSPCCRNGWYHRQCLQKYANSAGYFFKCPLCNDEEKFGEVASFGISIPNCDASWELEPNAFADQLQRAQHCTSSKCRIRPTTSHVGDGADLLYCIMCGSNPMHTQCTSETASTYRCADCIVVEPSSTDSDTEDDVFERFAEQHAHQFRAPATRELNDTRDLRHSKLVASMRVSSESDDDDDDDEDDFVKISRILNQSRQLGAKPAPETSSSSAQTSSDRPVTRGTRRTLPITILEQNENVNKKAKKRRESSKSPVAAPESRRLLQPISPRTTAARSNVFASESRRRRTMPYSNSRYAAPERINMDESCVANRTRTRLPTYMANKK